MRQKASVYALLLNPEKGTYLWWVDVPMGAAVHGGRSYPFTSWRRAYQFARTVMT